MKPWKRMSKAIGLLLLCFAIGLGTTLAQSKDELKDQTEKEKIKGERNGKEKLKESNDRDNIQRRDPADDPKDSKRQSGKDKLKGDRNGKEELKDRGKYVPVEKPGRDAEEMPGEGKAYGKFDEGDDRGFSEARAKAARTRAGNIRKAFETLIVKEESHLESAEARIRDVKAKLNKMKRSLSKEEVRDREAMIAEAEALVGKLRGQLQVARTLTGMFEDPPAY